MVSNTTYTTQTSFTCRCRHCGFAICYAREDVGHDARCPGCGDSVRLPGKLTTVALINRVRRKNPQGLALELTGFVMMFFVFPWGMFVGSGVVYMGWRKSTSLVCSSCGGELKERGLAKCPDCKSNFGSE